MKGKTMCDACEQTPCRVQLSVDVSELLAELDSLARDFDVYDYGLPLGLDEGPDGEMRAAVIKFLAQYRPDINSEAT